METTEGLKLIVESDTDVLFYRDVVRHVSYWKMSLYSQGSNRDNVIITITNNINRECFDVGGT